MNFIEVELEGEIEKYGYEESIQGDPAYNINDDQVSIIKVSKQKEFEEEIEWLDAFKPYMECFLTPEKDKDKEAERKYKVRAVMTVFEEFVNSENDTALAKSIIDNLDSKIDHKIQEFKDDDALYKSVCANGHKLKNGDIKEIYWTRGQRMVRVRNFRTNSLTVWYPRQTVERQIRQEAEEAQAEPQTMAREAELKIFEKKFWDESGALTEGIEKFNKECNVGFFEDNNMLDSSLGAQFLRYSSESAFGASISWKDNIEAKASAKAEGSFALAQAQGSFSVHLPNEDGFGLMQFLKTEVPDFVKDDFTEIFMKVSLTTTGSAFLGVCASVSLDLGVSVTEDKKAEGKAQAGIELFAGAKAQAEAKFSVDTMFVDDDRMDEARKKIKTVKERGDKPISSKGLGEWKSLGEAVFGAYQSWGLGLDASFMCGYIKDIGFSYQAKIGATLKAGAGTFVKGTVDAQLIGKFLFTVAQGVNWINLSDRIEKTGQVLLHTVMSNCFYLGKKVDEIYTEIWEKVKDNFNEFLEFITDLNGFASKGMGELKIVDDKLDDILPGYTSFKQHNQAFIILHDAYKYFNRIDEKERAIQAVQNAQEHPMRWRYATWQMKVNLIYDMRHTDKNWFEKFSKEDRGQAVLDVLDSARHKTEFGKIMYALKNVDVKLDRQVVNVGNLLSKNQKIKLEEIKIEYQYFG